MNELKVLQTMLNKWGMRGKNGKPLTVDGLRGVNTSWAIANAKTLLKMILK